MNSHKNDRQANKKKVMIVTNIPTPYRIPLFNELHDQLGKKSIGLKVVFGGSGYARRRWKIDLNECRFEHSVLGSKTVTLRNWDKTMFLYSGLFKLLVKEKPDLLLVIGFSFATLKIWLFTRFCKRPFVIWSGSIRGLGGKISFLRRALRRFLVKRSAGFVAYGTLARDYLLSMGAPAERVEIGINTTDTRFYADTVATLRRGVQCNEKNLLYIGHLAPRKRVDLALRAVEIVARKRDDFRFQVVGDGLDRPRLKDLCREMGIEKIVVFHGFKQKPEIPDFLAQADCFLFPSEYDVWGLVLVEAMAAGLPCISSIRSGATHDLIEEGETGFALDFADTDLVVEKILWILGHPQEAREMGGRAAAFIRENVSLEKSAQGFVRAIEKALAGDSV